MRTFDPKETLLSQIACTLTTRYSCGMTDLAGWLSERGFGHLIDLFEENEIDGEVLFDLTGDDLKDLGLTLGARKKLLKAIAADENDGRAAASGFGPIAEPSSPTHQEAERRQLTIMFVDLVGSTALAGKLDPEDMRAVMTSYQNAVAGMVTRFEGHIAKYMGDGVLCYFGWPKAHEDAAERAVRVALAILQAMEAIKTPAGDALAVRIGIATGLVVVGDLIGEGAAREQAVIGETPNLAARLQGLAVPGQVCVSETTRLLIGDTFELIDTGGHELKGIEGKTPAYVVTAERAVESRFEARSFGSVSAMVGRNHELGLMLERWKQAAAGEGQLLLLTGDAGIGKSRITRAMIDALADEPHIRISYQCSPYHTDSSLYPAIQQLTFAAGIKDSDSNDEKLDKLEAVLVNGDTALIATLLRLDTKHRYGPLDMTPQQQRTRTLQALTDQLTAMAQDKPVLFVLEDAHWIDASTLELLENGLDQYATERVCILITARPTFDYGFGGHPIVTKLALNRLGREQVAGIVDKITGGKTLPRELLDEIVARTDGVPLFVEELTKTVVESGELRETETSFELAGPLSRLAIPATLHDSLMARLDRLQPIKEVAQMAACIGREFGYQLIESISPLDGNALQDALEQLVSAELIFRRGAVPNAIYTFKHALVRDAAYESLLRSRRQANHAKLVDALLVDEKAAPELVAYHATQADLKEKAVELWAKAGTIAMAQPAYVEAIGHINSAIAVIGQMEEREPWRERELELYVLLAQAFMPLRGYGSEEATKAFECAAELIDATDNTELLIAVHYGRWIGPYIRGDINSCLDVAEWVVKQVDDLEDVVPRLMAHRMRAASLIALGRSGDALRDLEVSFGLYQQNLSPDFARRFPQEPGVQLKCYQFLGLWMAGYADQALAVAEEAVKAGRTLNHANTLCYAGLHQGMLAVWCRDVGLLEACNTEVFEIAKEHEMSMWINFFSINDALIEIGKNNDAAIDRMEAEIERYISGGNGLWLPVYMAELAKQLLRLGRLAPADNVLQRAFSRMEVSNERWAEPELYRIQGEVHVAQSDNARAADSFQRAIGIARQQETKPLELRAATNLARLWAEEGEADKARDLLEPIYNWFTEGLGTRDLRDAKAVLDQIG